MSYPRLKKQSPLLKKKRSHELATQVCPPVPIPQCRVRIPGLSQACELEVENQPGA